eukprot:GEMP01045840.1.p1 GENE.GEMP01045840.1~~GEMP01045840.1.p1  ORF type:complete len:386 (+),score=67.59 GEMP01045840.1:67-1224(+)
MGVLPDWKTITGVAVVGAAVYTGCKVVRWRQKKQREMFAKQVAKVELHCHLGGSVRTATLIELAKNKKLVEEEQAFLRDLKGEHSRSLRTCFKIFDLVYKVIDNHEALRRILRELLIDLSADNVFYVEVRSSPRALADGTTKEEYVTLLIEEIKLFLGDHSGAQPSSRAMDVRLLVSIDRSKSVEHAWDVLNLVKKVRQNDPDELICGFDFCGNPMNGRFEDFRLVFHSIRDLGLKITVHAAELMNNVDTDTIIAFGPDRLGHMLYLDAPRVNYLLERRIPVEICPTSNIKTNKLSGIKEHPTLKLWNRHQYPFSISTDDCGVVFDTRPSDELVLVANLFRWSIREMAQFCENVASHTFLPPKRQQILRAAMHEHNQRVLELRSY